MGKYTSDRKALLAWKFARTKRILKTVPDRCGQVIEAAARFRPSASLTLIKNNTLKDKLFSKFDWFNIG